MKRREAEEGSGMETLAERKGWRWGGEAVGRKYLLSTNNLLDAMLYYHTFIKLCKFTGRQGYLYF